MELELESDLKTANNSESNLEEKVDLNKQIEKFKEKTGQDFSTFYLKYLPKLVYYTTKYCGDEDEAMDFAEEAFIISLEKIDSYNSEKAGFSTWLFVITRNHVFQHLKKKKRLPTISMDVTIDEEGTTIEDFLSGDEEEMILESELKSLNKKKAEIMKSCISRLKVPYRTVIELREMGGLSYKDISSKLGRDVSFDIVSSDRNPIELPKELSEAYEVLNVSGDLVKFALVEGDSKKTPFFTHIVLDPGTYVVKGRCPKNISTIKSQIRNGRLKLQDMVKEDFHRLNEMYR